MSFAFNLSQHVPSHTSVIILDGGVAQGLVLQDLLLMLVLTLASVGRLPFSQQAFLP